MISMYCSLAYWDGSDWRWVRSQEKVADKIGTLFGSGTKIKGFVVC